jgi:CO/xanthine dehydrogenase Mo-binding subunit
MQQLTFTRRQFAQFVVLGGLGLTFASCNRAAASRPLSPDWWLELYVDGDIRLLTKRVEMGQGAHTGLRTLLAEELDIEPGTLQIAQVPSDPRYGEIITGGSFTLAGWQERMRRAGATARHMLMLAAARRWDVPVAEIATQAGELRHLPSGRSAAYREFVAAAAAISPPAPESVQLKAPSEWRYIGKPGAIAHHAEIAAGTARYGIDLRLPEMCFAVLARAPVLGARLVRFDDSEARRVAGFIKALGLDGNTWPTLDHHRDAVAVVASNSWAAQRAREALRIEWDLGARRDLDTQAIFATIERECARDGIVSRNEGDAGSAPRGERRLEAKYVQPYLAHAPLEPPNATARCLDGRIEVWCGNQRQTRLKDAIVRELGFAPENVTVHATLIGGSFGRRLEIDYGMEAAKLAKALQRPVQLLWTREDDMRHALYRSGSVHRLAAALDRQGRVATFTHRYAAESVLAQQEPKEVSAERGDWTIAAPLVSFFYEVPDVRMEHRPVAPLVPCAWWRGTYWNNVTAAVECFMDELAQLAGEDPLAFRVKHLPTTKREFVVTPELRIPFDPLRMRRVLEAIGSSTLWKAPQLDGHARGIACGIYDSPECHAAVAVEMVMRDGAPWMRAATVAVDVGTAVNPSIVQAQAMGGFVMGASAALRERITWKHGAVEQQTFAHYQPLRMHDCPPVEVIIVPSDAGICGVGEIVTPAAIGAVTNAASRLLGRRIRSWPILE